MSMVIDAATQNRDQSPIVLVGGYGVVGAQIAEMFQRRHPDRPIVLAGRSHDKAREAAAPLPNARGAAFDIADEAPLSALTGEVGLVVSVVNDPSNNLLRDTIRRGAAYLDIARWTERLKPAVFEAVALAPRAPVVFASSWMAGVPGLFATHLARRFRRVDRVELSILYALKDKAGPNSVEYADQLGVPFEVFEDGVWRTVRPLSEPREVTFGTGRHVRVRRFATPDLEILPRTTGARNVGVRLSYDDPGAAGMMAFLVTSGIWKALSGKRFEGLRRSLIYHPGSGDAHEVAIEIWGRDQEERTARVTAAAKAPLGQTHMTAAGAVVQMERILGLGGCPAPESAVCFAESHPDPALALASLRDMGIELSSAAT